MECNFAWHVLVSMLNLEKFEPWPYCAFHKRKGWGEIKIFYTHNLWRLPWTHKLITTKWCASSPS